MGKPSIKDFFCSQCKKTKKIRAKKGQKFCSGLCSSDSRKKSIHKMDFTNSLDDNHNIPESPDLLFQQYFTNSSYDIDNIPESPDLIVQQYLKKNNALLTRAKNLETEVKLLKNNINFSQNISNVLEKGIRSLPLIESLINTTKNNKITHEEESVLLLSDLHSAEVISAFETDNLAEYNFEIFCLRMQKLLDSVIRITDIQKKGGAKLDTLNIFSLGDLISGEIHLELLKTNEFPLITSAFQLSVVLAQFIAKLSILYKKINFYGVNGNHDRISEKKMMKGRYDDIAQIIYQTLPLLTKKYRNIEYFIPQSPFKVVNIFDWKYLLTHGDMKISGAVYTGMEKLSKEFQSMYKSRGGFDLMVVGHYHNPAKIDGVMINGSLVGGSEYSINAVRKNTPPSQKFFGVSKSYVHTWMYDVFVGDVPETHQFIYNSNFLAHKLMEDWESNK